MKKTLLFRRSPNNWKLVCHSHRSGWRFRLTKEKGTILGKLGKWVKQLSPKSSQYKRGLWSLQPSQKRKKNIFRKSKGFAFTYPWERFLSQILQLYKLNYFNFIIIIFRLVLSFPSLLILLLLLLLILLLFWLILLSLLLFLLFFCYCCYFVLWYVDLFGQIGVLLVCF